MPASLSLASPTASATEPVRSFAPPVATPPSLLRYRAAPLSPPHAAPSLSLPHSSAPLPLTSPSPPWPPPPSVCVDRGPRMRRHFSIVASFWSSLSFSKSFEATPLHPVGGRWWDLLCFVAFSFFFPLPFSWTLCAGVPPHPCPTAVLLNGRFRDKEDARILVLGGKAGIEALLPSSSSLNMKTEKGLQPSPSSTLTGSGAAGACLTASPFLASDVKSVWSLLSVGCPPTLKTSGFSSFFGQLLRQFASHAILVGRAAVHMSQKA